ncbi:hypothetical protein BGZ99_002970, partial [Dissophora globulifera]
NKLVKSFMDDFLIGESLEKYTTLREFQLLTCMEKCLLAHRMPQWRSSVALWIKSRVRNTKVASDVKLFKTVMKSGAVEEVGAAPPSPSGKEKNAFLDLEAEVDDDDYESKSDDYEMLEHQSSPRTTAAANFPKPPAPAFSFGGFGASVSASAFGAPASTSLFGSAAPPPPPTGAVLFGSPPPPPIVAGLVTASITRPPPMPTPAPPPPTGSMFNQNLRFMDTRSDTDSMEARQRAQQQLEQLQQFKPVDLTKEMAETYYWERQDAAIETGKTDVNAFWLDFVEWNETKGESFLTQNFLVNTRSFTDAMATIALLDVTFKPNNASVKR